MCAFSKFETLRRNMLCYELQRCKEGFFFFFKSYCFCKAFSPSPRRGLALGGHFVSGLMHGFSRCHFDYISESVVASRAAGLMKARLLK